MAVGSEERSARDTLADGLDMEIDTAEVLAREGIAAALANKPKDGGAVKLTDVCAGIQVEDGKGREDDSPTKAEGFEVCGTVV